MATVQHNKFMIKFICILSLSLFGLINTHCNMSNDNIITIGYMPIVECLPLFIAVENGYFKNENLDVQLMQFPGGSAILEAMSSNSVNIGFSNVVSLIYSHQGKKDFVSIWGATVEDKNHILHGLVTLKNKIDSPASLKNKTIAINTLRNIDDLLITKWLLKNGISRKDISLLEIPFPRMFSVLKKEDANAIAVVEPFLSIAKGDSSCEIMGNYYLGEKDEALITTYCSSLKWISHNKSNLIKFKSAMNKALEYYQENNRKSRMILLKYTKIQESIIDKINLPIFRNSQPTTKELEYYIKEMYNESWLDRTYNPKEIIYEQ